MQDLELGLGSNFCVTTYPEIWYVLACLLTTSLAVRWL